MWMWLTDYVANRWKLFAEIITNQGPEPQPVVSVYYLYTCRYLRVLYNHMLITTTLPSDFLFKYQSDKDLKTTRTETHFTKPLKKIPLKEIPFLSIQAFIKIPVTWFCVYSCLSTVKASNVWNISEDLHQQITQRCYIEDVTDFASAKSIIGVFYFFIFYLQRQDYGWPSNQKVSVCDVWRRRLWWLNWLLGLLVILNHNRHVAKRN